MEQSGIRISANESFDMENLKNIALDSIDFTLRNNSDELMIEDVTSDKWKVDGNNATSYIMSMRLDSFSDYQRMETILFLNDNQDRFYIATFVAPSHQFDILETQALEKRLIDSIKISK